MRGRREPVKKDRNIDENASSLKTFAHLGSVACARRATPTEEEHSLLSVTVNAFPVLFFVEYLWL